MQQMDFEPGAQEPEAWHEIDMKQNSMLLSVTKELPALEQDGVDKKKIKPGFKMFPKHRWFQPFPAYDKGSSPKDGKRKCPDCPEGAQRQPFTPPKGDGKVMFAESILPVCCFSFLLA